MKASSVCPIKSAKRGIHKKILLFVLIIVILLTSFAFILTACNNEYGILNSVTELENKPVATVVGTIFAEVAEDNIPGVTIKQYENVANEIAALTSGKVAAVITDQPIARNLLNQFPGLKILPEILMDDSYGYAFNKGARGTALCNQISEVIKKYKNDGTLAEIDAIWFGTDESKKVLPPAPTNNENGTIKFCTDTATAPPFDYMRGSEIVGYDIHLMRLICTELGYGLEIRNAEFDSLIMSVQIDESGMTMAGASMSITEDRKEKVAFSEPIYTGGVVALTLSGEKEQIPLGDRIRESFRKTFVDEQRYTLIFEGLGVTVLITVLSAIFGTLLASGVCAMRISKKRWLNVPAMIYVKLIQGVPVLVLLLILMFLVFAKADVSGVFIAVIGFSINFSAYVCEMMRTSLQSVSPGETEAAAAMGFSKTKNFMNIALPQATRRFLPVFKGEFISMMKMTSIVGYIAVVDLTRAGDIITGQTYEAFFPLIAIALLYLILSLLLTSLLSLIEINLDPLRRKRHVRGVIGQPEISSEDKDDKGKPPKKMLFGFIKKTSADEEEILK